MIIDYRPGDDIICIRDHSQGAVKKGQVFTAIDLTRIGCGCVLLVDVGLKSDRPFTKCAACGMNDEKTDNIWWLDARSFRRLMDKDTEAEFESAMNELFEEELISLN